ncbi:MAG: hypothetical protein ACRDAM_11545 [Casimicrobium sp.]
MKQSILLAFTALASVCAVTGSFAANNFTKSDGNRDGALTRAEACVGRTPAVCKNFNRIDANRDGVVTRSEVKAFNNAKRARRGLPQKP